MSGCHHHHHHHHHHSGSKNILIAFLLNFCFAIIEFIGGYLTNSMAIYSDALHDLGDSTALLMSYFFEKFSKKGSDQKYTYGYRRFSLLSALLNAVILLIGSIFVISESFERLMNPEPVVSEGMFALAILGIVVNGVAAFRMSKESGINQRMVMLHLMEDLLGWFAVLIVSVVLYFKPWYILDSILSILISLLVLKGVYQGLKRIVTILMQAFPKDLNIDDVKSELIKIDGVEDVHYIQGWSMDEESHSLTFHVSVPDDLLVKDLDLIKKVIKAKLFDMKVSNSVIEFEGTGHNCDHVSN
ncbi:putative cation efflux system protein [Halobacteriovorax marinus SJ]|uniref:Cation efflux system protein n=1 Tax=Halobacteriovorax marinus (strain ATCC BAA-682 / DSM 15412 / SJ) TaxID=862908 RepID=E1WXS4_HALMS|nr:cation diffusion facilitator family transporter [Halobacteriovorax marinus]CBW25881.1 putative cation efflux system protein [Halobacteriovorax marinus SJ]